MILATGGLSFPRTGSDGTGYALATALGHTLVPPVPALTPLAGEDPLCTAAQGLSADAELTLWAAGKREVTVRGPLQASREHPARPSIRARWNRAIAPANPAGATLSTLACLRGSRARAFLEEPGVRSRIL